MWLKQFIKNLGEKAWACGIDRVAHFGIGGTITALCILAGMIFSHKHAPLFLLLYSAVGFGLTFILSMLKEYSDERWDWTDVAAGLAGAALVAVAVFLSVGIESLL